MAGSPARAGLARRAVRERGDRRAARHAHRDEGRRGVRGTRGAGWRRAVDARGSPRRCAGGRRGAPCRTRPRRGFRRQLPHWLQAVAGSLEAGVMLFIDYGYVRREYYQPERRDGTLMAHYRHHAHADPLWLPGLNDLTASVDFTALAEAGNSAGFGVAAYL